MEAPAALWLDDRVQQWRVLRAVQPLFATELPWRPYPPARCDLSIENHVDFFRNEMKTLAINQPDHELSPDSFQACLDTLSELLEFLERVVNDKVLKEVENVAETAQESPSRIPEPPKQPEHSTKQEGTVVLVVSWLTSLSTFFAQPGLGQSPDPTLPYPPITAEAISPLPLIPSPTDEPYKKLQALGKIVKEVLARDGDLVKYCQHLVKLEHSVQEFAKAKNLATNVNKCLESVQRVRERVRKRVARKIPKTQWKDRRPWDLSRTLFRILNRRFQFCSGHRAMLQLNGFQQEDTTALTTFDMFLSCCKDVEGWQESRFTQLQRNSDPKSKNVFISTLCNSIQESNLSRTILSLHFDEKYLWDTPNSPEALIYPPGCHTLTLEYLLENGYLQKKPDSDFFAPFDKAILALTLGRSLLHLFQGSWMQQPWSAKDVRFLYEPAADSVLNIQHPYIQCALSKNKAVEDLKLDTAHWQSVVLAFGQLLLEIEMGKKIAINQNNLQHSLIDILDDVDTVDGFARDDYFNAIEGCLKFNAQLKKEIGNDLADRVRKVLYKHIVVLLEANIDLFRDPASLLRRPRHLSLGKEQPATRRFMPHPVPQLVEQGQRTSVERRELCRLRDSCDREMPVDPSKKSMAEAWLKWHNDAHARIESELRKSASNAQRVKIAILDSGIQLSPDHKAMYDTEPRIQYGSWVNSDIEWRDVIGHGTHLAVLLRKIAPNAIIHVARVFEKKPDLQKSGESIANAIRHAVDEWEVDIIVMSFGFGARNDKVFEEIKYAAYKEVLMFAAASNDGKNRPDGVAWPASESRVICVHSGDGFGNPSLYTPSPQENMKIMVLGECVRSAWPQELKSLESLDGFKHMSGTSCAAPIAAGIAAIILDYARGFLSQKDWESLRRVDSMRRMFESLKDPHNNTGYWWIKHWQMFEPNRNEGWIQEEIRRFL